jgi:hypothetical protein
MRTRVAAPTPGEQDGSLVPARRQVRLELRDIASEPTAVRAGNAPTAWRYDPEQRRLVIDLQETAASQSIDLSMK